MRYEKWTAWRRKLDIFKVTAEDLFDHFGFESCRDGLEFHSLSTEMKDHSVVEFGSYIDKQCIVRQTKKDLMPNSCLPIFMKRRTASIYCHYILIE